MENEVEKVGYTLMSIRQRDLPYRSAPLIKKYRKQKKLTQYQLALRLGVSRSCVANWEAHLRAPTVEQYCALAKILDVNVGDLF